MGNDDMKTLMVWGREASDREMAKVGDVQYVRESDGTWRYADSWVKVPGARDLTLTERFRPKFIVSDDNQVERVVVSADAIAEAPELLGWCLDEGTQVTDANDQLAEIIVPIELWDDRDRIPGAIVAPEHSNNEAERELAEAERTYREADQALELAASARAEVLRRHSETMTRQEARAITGLSVGRIQQLIRNPSLDDLDRKLLEVIEFYKPASTKAFHRQLRAMGLTMALPALRRRLRDLGGRDLVTTTRTGFRLTNDGLDVLAEPRAADNAEVEPG